MLSALIVEDEPWVSELLSTWLQSFGFATRRVSHGGEALDALAVSQVDLILTDIQMPVMDGFALLRSLALLPHRPPVIVITGAGDVASAVRAMKLGALDYLSKPVRADQLKAAVESALSAPPRSSGEIEMADGPSAARTIDPYIESLVSRLTFDELSDPMLDVLVAALDARERETGMHSRRVSQVSVVLGARCGISGERLVELRRGALLHDLGKIGVSDAVLRKPDPLTPSEWSEMRLHPEIGARILSKVEHWRPVSELVYCHHERFDGSGYPRKLRGEAIPLSARIFAVADSLDAMLSRRPYRAPQALAAAVDELVRCAGGQFDPEVIAAFRALPQEQWLPWYENVMGAAM